MHLVTLGRVCLPPQVRLRIYGRLAGALMTLASWNAGRVLKWAPERQYLAMNSLLRQLVQIVTECQNVLDCEGEMGCVVKAQSQHEAQLQHEEAQL